MKILAVDTATQACSIAVLDGDNVLAEAFLGKGQTHSRHLLKLIDKALDWAAISIEEIEGVAVTRGPGSFTGLRIGISTIKGIAYALGKPVVGVSSLDALAYQFAQATPLVCPLLDARKHEVYFAVYRFLNGRLVHKTEELAANPREITLGKVFRENRDRCLFLGDGVPVYKTLLEASFGPRAVFASEANNQLRASAVGALSMNRFEKGQVDDAASLIPSYIRKSDAELRLGPKKQNVDPY